MPTMNGIELNQQINEKHLDSLVVYLTGYSDFQYMQAAIREHAADYLLKPIKHEELYTCLQKIHQKLDKKYHILPNAEINSSYYRKIILEVVHYLEENYQNATLTEAATRVNLSPNYLSRIFREKSEIGFSELLTQIRMKKLPNFYVIFLTRHMKLLIRSDTIILKIFQEPLNNFTLFLQKNIVTKMKGTIAYDAPFFLYKMETIFYDHADPDSCNVYYCRNLYVC